MRGTKMRWTDKAGQIDVALPYDPSTGSGRTDSAGEIISGGNFHAEPVALVADAMALAIAEVGAIAARRLQPMIASTAHILGIELLAAAQGIEFLPPLQSSPALEAVHARLREACPSVECDRYLAPDIERATALMTDGSLARILRSLPGLPTLWTPA